MKENQKPEVLHVYEKEQLQPKSMLSAADIAEYLNISEHTVYRWCKSGKIPYYNLESTYRFDKEEFETWLASKHQSPDGGGK